MSKEKTKRCKKCGTEMPKKEKICPECGAKQPKKWWKILIAIIVVIFGLELLFGSGSSDKEETNAHIAEEMKVPEDEYKSSCAEVDYKTIMRNPDDYVGKRFWVDVEISDVEDGTVSYPYAYKAYSKDEDGYYNGDFYYFMDARPTDSDNYLKVLEGDHVRVYGTFEGLLPTENKINGSKSEDMSLAIYYVELLDDEPIE